MIYLIAGISSIISGLGVGGGATFIIFTLMFNLLNITQARAYNLLMFISVGIIIFIKKIKKEKIINRQYIKCLLLVILGCSIGIFLNKYIEEKLLKKFFYIFMLVIGSYEIISSLKNMRNAKNISVKGEI